jgi:cyclopropane fatty-acyl-phospholipid synthase-like methyltransferase
MARNRSVRYVPALGRDWLTPLYDPLVRLTTRERSFKQRLLDQTGLRAGMKALDLGCGTGTLAVWAKERVPEAEVVGLDGDPKVLERARKKAERARCIVRFDQALSDELPYEDASFDRVLSSLLFHHLTRPDKKRTIAEVRRVLRPGGELHMADWGAPANPMMKALSVSIRILDGLETTRDNLDGALPAIFESGGLGQATERGQLSTIYGTLAFYSAVKPHLNESG